jgi:hypothetical protein
VQSDDVWRWRPDAVSSEEPRTVSSLDSRGGGEALMARQVGRRSCGAKAAVRRDELEGASMQPNTAVLQGATRVCRPCFSGTCAGAKEGSAREQENPRVRGEVGIANPFGSIISSHDPRHPVTSTLRHRRALLLANLVRRGNSLSACSPS